MINDAFTAKKVAELLIQINAIKLEPKNPFTKYRKFQYICDNRIVLSYPTVRTYIREQFAKQLEVYVYGKPDVIAYVATGAIGIGALVAEELNLPFVYIRPKLKRHGRKNQIEGILPKNSQVVVIEDLISTGKSSIGSPSKFVVKTTHQSSAYYRFLITIFRLPKNDLKKKKLTFIH